MTQQFKFGDRVRHKEHGESVVVWTTDDTADQWVEVAYQNGKANAYPNTDLELIPHPDTVRLDWLADHDQHIGNVQLPAECVACNLHSMRDAIDMAMQMQPENGAGTQEKDA